MSRFAKYKNGSGGDLPPLFRPSEGESRVGLLIGDREHVGKDDSGNEKVVPVLDFRDPDSGERWSFMSSAWRWVSELEDVDPQLGDLLRVSRRQNIGRSWDLRLEVLRRANEPKPAEGTRVPSAPAAEPDDTNPPF